MASSLVTRTPPPGRLLRRPGALLALALTLVLSLLVMAPQPAQAVAPHSVSVTDTTGEVDPELLQARLRDVDFREQVDLAVVVLDVTEYGSDPSQDTALNDAVLAHARDTAPELLSEDGEHWAEGTVVLALDPANRHLGTYGGEDVALDEAGFEAVQDAMRDHAAHENWSDALEAGTQKYAGLLDRPWWQHPAALVAAALVVGVALVLGGAALVGRRTARRHVEASLPRYRDVQQRRARTEAAARALPPSSPYARAAMVTHEDFLRRLQKAKEMHDRLPAPERRSWTWGLTEAQRKLARSFEGTVRHLDDADDDLLATSDLLRRTGSWRTAWERELRPLRDSLSAGQGALPEEADASAQEAAAAAEVRELSGDIATELDTLTAQLETEAIDPDSALERLDTLTRELSAAVSRLQDGRIARIADDDEERELLQGAAADVQERGYRSVRGRRHALEHGTTDSAGSTDSAGVFWALSPLLWYSSWSTQSATALETHRGPAATGGGSTTGYSPAAGGFSGAGSSSRF